MYIGSSLITKELNRMFPGIEFKNKYKEELSKRVIFFVISEIKKKKEELSIEKYEEFLINFLFFSKRKEVSLETLTYVEDNFFKDKLEELLLLINPLYYERMTIKEKDYEELLLYFLLKEKNKSFNIEHQFYIDTACNLSKTNFNKRFYSFCEGTKKDNLLKEKIKLLNLTEKINLVRENKNTIFFSIEGIKNSFNLKDKNISLYLLFSKIIYESSLFKLYINEKEEEMNSLNNLFCSMEDLFELVEIEDLVSSNSIKNFETKIVFKNSLIKIEFIVGETRNDIQKRECFRIIKYIDRRYKKMLEDLLFVNKFYEELEEKISKY